MLQCEISFQNFTLFKTYLYFFDAFPPPPQPSLCFSKKGKYEMVTVVDTFLSR